MGVAQIAVDQHRLAEIAPRQVRALQVQRLKFGLAETHPTQVRIDQQAAGEGEAQRADLLKLRPGQLAVG